MRRCVLILIAFLIAQSAFASSFAQRNSPALASKPNVVLIIMDDLGYGDLGSYGARDARTPSLDRLARDGARLTNAYANAANCTPTRAALISGRYQQRVGLEWPLEASEQDRGLPVRGGSLPALLKRYRRANASTASTLFRASLANPDLSNESCSGGSSGRIFYKRQ